MATNLGELRQAAVMNVLRNSQLFTGLPQTELARIAGFSVIKTLSKGEYLFHRGDTSLGFYVVQKGAINVHRVSASGKEQVIHVFRAGESFAEASLATDDGYPGDARAVESSQVILIQKPDFLALLRRQPELAVRMLGSMSVHLRVLVGQLEDLTLKDIETRLAHWLLQRCPEASSNAPVTLALGMTKRTLAAELGTASETLSRTLAKLRAQQLISIKPKSIVVLSPTRLREVVRRHLGE